MTERPILFSGPIVRAILEGRKTQTRRIVKLPPASQGWRFIECAFNSDDSAHYHAGFAGNAEFRGSIVCVNCPYGKPPDPLFKTPGDLLCVRDRITLEITDVGVERLQQISEADALAEGCSSADMRSGDSMASVYARLWQSIHGAGS
jgi:hypothetical protein